MNVNWRVFSVLLAAAVAVSFAYADESMSVEGEMKAAGETMKEKAKAAGERMHETAEDAARKIKEPMAEADKDKRIQAALNLQRLNDLLGRKVVNQNQENLGEIEDIVLDGSHSRVAYLVLGVGGVLDIGQNLFAVPWDAFRFAEGQTQPLTLNVTADRLKEAPGFDKGNWPDMASADWRRDVDQFYERAESDTGIDWDWDWGEDNAFEARKISEIIGMDVQQPDGNDIGEIENLVAEVNQGRIAYAIVSFGGFLDIGDKLAALPWNSLTVQPDQMAAITSATEDTFETVAFEEGNWPNLSDQQYAQQLHERFNEEPYWVVYGFVDVPEEQRERMEQMREERMREQSSQRQPGERQSAAEVWAPDSEYNKHFDPQNITTIQGTIESVGTFHPGDSMAEGRRLRVRTEDGQMMVVHLGPANSDLLSDLDLRRGQQIAVAGSKAEIDGRNVMIAAGIKQGDTEVELRSKEDGRPLWKQDM